LNFLKLQSISAENIIFNNSGIADILMWVDETKLLYYVYDYDQNAYEYYIYDLEIGQATKQNFLSMHQVFEDYQVTWFTIDWHDQLAIGYSVRPENGGTKDLSELVESPKVSTILIGHWANAHLFSVAIKGQIVESPIWLKDRNMGVVVVNETIDSEDIFSKESISRQLIVRLRHKEKLEEFLNIISKHGN